MTARPVPLLVVVVAAVLSLPVLAQQAPPAPSDAELAAERELFRLANQERARAGVPGLELDARMVQAARSHARRMAEHRELAHQFSGEPILTLRLAATGLRFDHTGENVGRADEASQVHQDFLASGPHHANMTDPDYNAAGIGVAIRGGQVWVAEDFAHRTPEYSDAEVEDLVASAYVRFRREKGGSPPKRLEQPLRDGACAMARADELGGGVAGDMPGAHTVVFYTATRPERLPAELTDRARGGPGEAFAVGACFGRNSNHPEGAYWIAVALY